MQTQLYSSLLGEQLECDIIIIAPSHLHTPLASPIHISLLSALP